MLTAAQYSKIPPLCNSNNVQHHDSNTNETAHIYPDDSSDAHPRGDLQDNAVELTCKYNSENLPIQKIDSFISLIKYLVNNPQEVTVIYSKLSMDNRRLLNRLLEEWHLASESGHQKPSTMSRTGIFRSATSPNPFTASPNSPTAPRKLSSAGLNGHAYQPTCALNSNHLTVSPLNGAFGWNQSQPAGLCGDGADNLQNLDLLTELARQQIQIANLEQSKRDLEIQLQELRGRFAEVSKPTESHTNYNGLLGDQLQLKKNGLKRNEAAYFDSLLQKSWPKEQQFNTSNSLDTSIFRDTPSDDKNRINVASSPYHHFPCSQYGYFAPITLSSGLVSKPDLAVSTETSARSVKDDVFIHNQYKSISLNELRHPQLNLVDDKHSVPPAHPPSVLDQARYSKFGTLVSSHPRVTPSASASLDVMNQLPPQYASKYHRQAHLVSKSPPPVLTTKSDSTRTLQTGPRTLSPQPAAQISPTTTVYPANVSTNAHQSPPTSPLVRRAKTPTEKVDRGVLNAMTTTKQMCHSEGRVPMITLNDNPENVTSPTSYVTLQSASTKSLRNSRIKNFFSETRDFIHWDKDVVSAWMYELGLGYAVPATRRWLRHGADLIYASRKDIEQEMGIHNPLHVKKLLLHMQLRTNEPLLICPSLPLIRMKLPPEFNIAAWLDDLGLTTYTASFSAAGIDPLTLNNLTMDDLFSMKITNELHILSLRRGLQILRRIRFNLSALSRGPANGDCSLGKQPTLEQPSVNRPSPFLRDESIQAKSAEKQRVVSVCYWTQYRVMTWLYSIELPEYAPDLSGSGVHGALMVLEDRFTPELLANILHVPVSKTLVRRHLTNKFAELVGEDMWRRKTEAQNNPTIQPLTQHSKLKAPKKRGFFTPQRKHKGFELDNNLVCPLDIDMQHSDLFMSTDCPTASVHSETSSVQLNMSDGDWTPSQSLSTDPSEQNRDP